MSVKETSQKLRNFAKILVGNRALDLYLKYAGIKTLNSATLVPFALLLGKDMFSDVIKTFVQKGGMIPKQLPVIDDPLLGTYLKLAGLTTINLTPETLLPLGVLMAVWELFLNKKQTGGAASNITKSLNDFAKKLVGNRALDLYLKYTGIKTLNSATLVPFALILGKDMFADVIKYGVVVQKGGKDPLAKNIPLVDDPLLGTYLKFMGLSTLDLTPTTLVPLGILVGLHYLYTNN